MSWLTITHVPALVLVLAFVVFAGVVLPAVWSTHPARRQAAAAVLAQFLTAARDTGDVRLSTPPSPPPAGSAPAGHQQPPGQPHNPHDDAHAGAS